MSNSVALRTLQVDFVPGKIDVMLLAGEGSEEWFGCSSEREVAD
jgi:hypothetical protein